MGMMLEEWEIPPDIADTPAEMAALGYGDRLRPLDGKKLAFRERGPFTVERLEFLVRRFRMNIGLRLHDGLVVVDHDGPELGPFAEIESPMRVRTTRGTHHYFRTETDHANRMHPAGLDIDILFHGVTPIPPSINWETGWTYRWEGPVMREEELPLFPMKVLQEFDPPPLPEPSPNTVQSPHSPICDIRAYISRIVAIQGHAGDKTTFRVACLIARSTGGDYHETLALLHEWNLMNAYPHWSDRELAYKARRAIHAVRL
jgi:hypothetical protein